MPVAPYTFGITPAQFKEITYFTLMNKTNGQMILI